MRKIQKRRAAVAGSEKSKIPKAAEPTTPIPVHTAYPVPIGMVLTANAKNQKLAISAMKVMTVGTGFVNPLEYFKPIAHAISSKPAANK